MLIPLAIFAVYVYLVARDNPNLKSFIKWPAFILIIVSLEATNRIILGIETNAEIRSKATFGNPTYFGTYLAVLLPLILSQCFSLTAGKSLRALRLDYQNWLIMLAFGWGLVGLNFASTRASLLGLAVGLTAGGLVFLHAVKPRWLIKGLVVMVSLLSLAILALWGLYLLGVSSFALRLLSVFNIETYYARLVGWIPAWQAFLDSIWFGHGLGSYYNLFFAYMWPETLIYHYEASYNHAHNEILQIAAEGGLLGLAGTFLPLVFHPVVSAADNL